MVVQTKNAIPCFNAQQLEAVCKVLADTNTGLSGSQIDYLLVDSKIPNVSPGITKWKRLFDAFVGFQNTHQVGNHVIVFIALAMNPANYTEDRTAFESRKERINAVLSLCGYEVLDTGKVHKVRKAKSLDEASQRANRLRHQLEQRNVHKDVLRFCKSELLQKNYFHAVFEAMKSITAKLRQMTGTHKDGVDLVHFAFGMKHGPPQLAINDLNTDTLRGEQRGFLSLLKGLYGTIRNPIAHEPKVEWAMSEQDALDILTMISLVHRKLDNAWGYRPI
jgi:uncharacterized protein (TIGR02391 family)